MMHEELSGKIIPNAFGMEVLNELKPAFDWKLYVRAMIATGEHDIPDPRR